MCRVKIYWLKKHSTATLDMKQLNSQWYSIMKNHLLSHLELEELSRFAELNDTVQEELENMNDSPTETPNSLINEPPLSAENLPTGIQTLPAKNWID